MDVEALRAACAAGRVPRLLYTIPNFQNPSGATLSAAKRRALVELCDEHDVLILEDDPYGKLRFEGEALPGLAEMAAPGRVIFTSSFSKTVAPGLRVGYMVCPPDLAGRLAAAAVAHVHLPGAARRGGDPPARRPGGHLPGEHRARHRAHARAPRRDDGRHAPHARGHPLRRRPPGGFFCWLTLPEGMSADALFERRRGGRRAYVRGSRLRRRGRRGHPAPRLQRGQPGGDRRGHGAPGRRLPRRRRRHGGRLPTGRLAGGGRPSVRPRLSSSAPGRGGGRWDRNGWWPASSSTTLPARRANSRCRSAGCPGPGRRRGTSRARAARPLTAPAARAPPGSAGPSCPWPVAGSPDRSPAGTSRPGRPGGR